MILFLFSCNTSNDCVGIAKELFKENLENEEAYKNGKIDLAIRLASNVIQLNPNNFIAYSNRGVFNYKKQIIKKQLSPEMKDSIYNDLYKSIRLCSEYEKAYKNIIQFAYDIDEFEIVEKYAKQHYNIFKPNNRILTMLGDALFSLKKFNEAIEYLDISLSNPPIDTSSYWVRGRCYREIGAPEKALNDFDTAIRLDSTQVLAFHERGVTYKELKKYGKAQDDYLQAIKLDSSRVETYFSMGSLCLDTGDPVLACLYYQKTLNVVNSDSKIVSNIDKNLLLSTIEKYCR